MQAGKLDKRITIQQKAITRDSDGAEIVTWQAFMAVWAAVIPVSGREYVQLKALESEQTTRVIMRHRPGVVPAMRVLVADRTLDIIDVREIAMARRTLELMCRDITGQ